MVSSELGAADGSAPPEDARPTELSSCSGRIKAPVDDSEQVSDNEELSASEDEEVVAHKFE